MNWLDTIQRHFNDWWANPGPSIAALLAGIGVTFLFFKERINILNERIRHRDDQLKVKDEAIETQSANTVRIEASVAPSIAPSSPPLPSEKPDRFRAINDQITQGNEWDIRHAITGTRYKLIFNPHTGNSKTITFLPNGSIGEGRNHQEHSWKIKNGLLEILDARGGLYSRFLLLHDKKSFHHTNEPKLQSIRGQYMVPL